MSKIAKPLSEALKQAISIIARGINIEGIEIHGYYSPIAWACMHNQFHLVKSNFKQNSYH